MTNKCMSPTFLTTREFESLGHQQGFRVFALCSFLFTQFRWVRLAHSLLILESATLMSPLLLNSVFIGWKEGRSAQTIRLCDDGYDRTFSSDGVAVFAIRVTVWIRQRTHESPVPRVLKQNIQYIF